MPTTVQIEMRKFALSCDSNFPDFAPMVRYFFNLSNGNMIRDLDGEECADLDAAKRSARQTARDLARNKSPAEIRDLYVAVTDESGKEVFRTPLAQ